MRRATCFFAILCFFSGPNYFAIATDDSPKTATNEIDITEIEIDSEQEEMGNILMTINSLGWCPDEDYIESKERTIKNDDINRGSADERIQDLCNKIKELRDVQDLLDENLDELSDNTKTMHENEQSFANRMLGGATTAATGLGMMTAASARAEQKADADAEQDMTAYLATFKCEYGRGLTAKAGNEEITLPGGNELLEYYSEYKSLADNLKNTKQALGLRPGIEQEIVYDKAQSNLYKYASTGITQGAYSSLSRALTDAEGKDAADWNAQKEKSAQNLKTGLIATGAGVVGGIVGNYLINKNAPKNRVDEILAKRHEIKSGYNNLVATLVAECNDTIQKHKEVVASLPKEAFASSEIQEYRQNVQKAQPITTIEELSESMFCK